MTGQNINPNISQTAGITGGFVEVLLQRFAVADIRAASVFELLQSGEQALFDVVSCCHSLMSDLLIPGNGSDNRHQPCQYRRQTGIKRRITPPRRSSVRTQLTGTGGKSTPDYPASRFQKSYKSRTSPAQIFGIAFTSRSFDQNHHCISSSNSVSSG